MKRMWTPASVLLVVAALCYLTGIAESQSTPEAPAGFDNRTNGFVNHAAFDKARDFFEKRFVIADGLGPVYNTQACAECHNQPVTGGSSQVNELHSGTFDGTSFTGHPGGTLISDRAIAAVIQETVFDSENVRAFRTSLNTLGDGFVECIADSTLTAIAANQPPAMRGQVTMVPVLEAGGALRVGRFGWKAQHASLVSFSADAYLNEMGITSPFLPDEPTSNGNSLAMFDRVRDPEISFRELMTAVAFVRSTKVPPRDVQLASTPDAQAGAQLFSALGCAICHTPSIVTAPAGTVINGGAFTVPPDLGGKIIHPYSDFLLHDVGTGDGIVQNGGQSTRNKIRTPALWGLRVRSRLMHGGQWFTANDAIISHQGEAALPALRYQGLTPLEKNQLLTFLKSL